MPMQTSKSVLGALKTQAMQRVEEHANDPIEIFGGDLPAGIEGVAQLAECGFEIAPKDAKTGPGKPRFMAMGVVMEPEFCTDANGVEVKVQGRQFRQYIPICDTTIKSGPNTGKKVTALENCDKAVMEMRKLYGDLGNGERSLVEDAGTTDPEELAPFLLSLDQLPFFRFRTRAGQATKAYPTPRVFTEWLGAVEDAYVPPESATGQVTETAPRGTTAPKPNGAAAKTPPPTRPGAHKPAAAPEPEPEPEPDAGDADAFNYAAAEVGELVALVAPEEADVEGDDEAGLELRRRAGELGYTDEQMDEEGVTWQDIGSWVEAGPQDETPAAEPEVPWEPSKGENHYKYNPIDPKTKKRAVGKNKKPLLVEVEVVLVNKPKQLVDIKNLATKAVYKAVPWAELVQP